MSGSAFLGTSEFAATVLEVLAGTDHRPGLVVTLPDRRRGRGRRELPSPVAERADELGIELMKSGDVNAPADRERIAAAGGEWASICAFGQLVRDPLLSQVPMMNVHPSLLPRWRGAAPIERAIMAGDRRTGVSIMRLVAGLDSGPVALVEETPVDPDEDFGTLSGRLAAIGGRLLGEAHTAAGEGGIGWTEQDDGTATYAEKIEPDERRIDPALSATSIHDQVRALTPHIGAWIGLENSDRLGVRSVTPLRDRSLTPGEFEAGGEELVLGCGEGAIRLDVVLPAGGKAMEGTAYLQGHGWPVLAADPE
ncbi:MAG: methionyl-tRNA formyltransferase [Thermoleophilia bacterium]|nr:methionyl-tRNA formyltransferase [Thermoleophilia bacterium]